MIDWYWLYDKYLNKLIASGIAWQLTQQGSDYWELMRW
jgi:hypothetical protein